MILHKAGSIVAGLCIVGWLLFANNNINETKAYRHLIPLVPVDATKGCGAVDNSIPVATHLPQTDSSIKRLREPIKTTNNTFYGCSIQHHVNQSVAYDLAFLEFNDDGKLIEPQQWTALEKHLKAQQNVNVLLFVHGWRNDAHIGSLDVERFHTMLSLSANYAQQDKGKFSKTIGIFIGWQGRLVDEKSDSNDPERKSWKAKALNKLAIPTILSRKPQSDSIAKPIGRKILEIEKLVKGENLEKHNNKLVIFGHSLGGNIVMRGLSDTLVDRLSRPIAGGEIRGVGDLVLLVNPASEARNFFAVQQASLTANANALQSPRVVSLTASKYFDRLTSKPSKWDEAVGKHLPLAHRLLSLNTGQPEDILSIGNYLPTRISESTATVGGMAYGVSHEIEIDYDAGAGTTYAMAGKTANANVYPRCAPNNPGTTMDWQAKAVANSMKINNSTTGIGWDAAGPTKENGRVDSRLTFERPDGGKEAIKINIRHGVVRHACTNFRQSALCRSVASEMGISMKTDQYVQLPTIGPAWSPVWNTAVHSNVIEEHGGYLSHTLWCVLNRFVLDRPAPNVPSKPN